MNFVIETNSGRAVAWDYGDVSSLSGLSEKQLMSHLRKQAKQALRSTPGASVKKPNGDTMKESSAVQKLARMAYKAITGKSSRSEEYTKRGAKERKRKNKPYVAKTDEDRQFIANGKIFEGYANDPNLPHLPDEIIGSIKEAAQQKAAEELAAAKSGGKDMTGWGIVTRTQYYIGKAIQGVYNGDMTSLYHDLERIDGIVYSAQKAEKIGNEQAAEQEYQNYQQEFSAMYDGLTGAM